MLKIKTPNILADHQFYSIEVLLREFLDINFELEIYKGNIIEISNINDVDNFSKLTLDASFFYKTQQDFLKPQSMPVLPLANWTPEDDGIKANLILPSVPVLYGSPGLLKNGNHIHLNLDIFGSAFFMLSRYEELIIKNLDNHDRFPSWASLAFKANFLNRPIVDEYLEILWACLAKLWPDLKRKNYQPELFISCDVDQPYDCTVETFSKLIKVCVGDLIRRRSLTEMLKRINRYAFNKLGIYKFDRNYTFDFYMDACEQVGLKAAFYFNPSSKEPMNGCYEITDKKIINLIKKIDTRGHEIGVHGSYQTYKDYKKILQQKILVEETLKKAGINQKIRGNRQHYLRWDSAVTPEYLDAAGFEYDTSGSYADRPGFRYGTCKKFSMWSWQNKKKLRLKQQPLIVMECSVADYMGLGYSDDAFKVMQDLKQKCQLFGGTFALLWHNSELQTEKQINMFKEIIKN
jgi:hypothetical protein